MKKRLFPTSAYLSVDGRMQDGRILGGGKRRVVLQHRSQASKLALYVSSSLNKCIPRFESLALEEVLRLAALGEEDLDGLEVARLAGEDQRRQALFVGLVRDAREVRAKALGEVLKRSDSMLRDPFVPEESPRNEAPRSEWRCGLASRPC